MATCKYSFDIYCRCNAYTAPSSKVTLRQSCGNAGYPAVILDLGFRITAILPQYRYQLILHHNITAILYPHRIQDACRGTCGFIPVPKLRRASLTRSGKILRDQVRTKLSWVILTRSCKVFHKNILEDYRCLVL